MKSSSRMEWLPLVMAPGRAGGLNTSPITGNSNSTQPFRVPLYLAFDDTGSGVPTGRSTEVTFLRIVGQYSLTTSTAGITTPETLWWSLTMLAPLKFDLETGLLLESSTQNSPGEFESHARPEVMWQRFHLLHRNLQANVTDQTAANSYFGPHGYPTSVIDIRVKRRLMFGEALALAITNHTFSIDRAFVLHLALKALVTFPGE